MASLIFLIIFISLGYLLLFTTVLDPLIKKLPTIPVPKNNQQKQQKHTEAAQQKRRKRARAAAKLYLGSHAPDLGIRRDNSSSDSFSNRCDSNSAGGDSDGSCDF